MPAGGGGTIISMRMRGGRGGCGWPPMAAAATNIEWGMQGGACGHVWLTTAAAVANIEWGRGQKWRPRMAADSGCRSPYRVKVEGKGGRQVRRPAAAAPTKIERGWKVEEATAYGGRPWPLLPTLSGSCGAEEVATFGRQWRPLLPTLRRG